MKNRNLISLALIVTTIPFYNCMAMEDLSKESKDRRSLSQVSLNNVHTLNLKGCKDIDFDELSKRKDAGNIININLEDTNVDFEGLKKLLESQTFGTKRDLPQISARYDLPDEEIYVNVKGTKIEESKKKELSQKPVGKFELEYKTGEKLEGIKWMKIKE